MKIKAIKPFRDKTSAEEVANQTLINVGDIIECDDELAKERIEKGFAEEVKKEVKKSK